MKAPRLTARDVALFESLLELRVLSVSQVERLFFPSRQTATRRLRALSRQGQVRVVRLPGLNQPMVFLTTTGAGALASSKQLALDDLPWLPKRQLPQDYLFLKHALQIGDFRIGLEEALRTLPDLKLGGFLPDHFGQRNWYRPAHRLQGTTASPNGNELLSHRPDAVFCLKRGPQAALFFLEVDRGTEVLSNPQRGVQKLLRFYLLDLTHGSYQRYGEDFGFEKPFRAFRALIVTNSSKRLENIRGIGRKLESRTPRAHRFIWLTTAETLARQGLLAPSWVSLDPEDKTRYTLLPNQRRKEDGDHA